MFRLSTSGTAAPVKRAPIGHGLEALSTVARVIKTAQHTGQLLSIFAAPDRNSDSSALPSSENQFTSQALHLHNVLQLPNASKQEIISLERQNQLLCRPDRYWLNAIIEGTK